MSVSTQQDIGDGKRKDGKAAISETLTIYDAAAGKQALLDVLDGVAELEIDLSAVTEIDTAGVQLLVMLKRAATKAGKKLRLVAHSPASLEVLDRYNLVAYFGDPVVISTPRSARHE
jgi:anti-anti-sigma regulatory factor